MKLSADEQIVYFQLSEKPSKSIAVRMHFNNYQTILFEEDAGGTICGIEIVNGGFLYPEALAFFRGCQRSLESISGGAFPRGATPNGETAKPDMTMRLNVDETRAKFWTPFAHKNRRIEVEYRTGSIVVDTDEEDCLIALTLSASCLDPQALKNLQILQESLNQPLLG